MRKASIRTAAMRMLFNIAKTRNLGAVVFCSALVIFGMQSQAAAQQVEKPGNLGENKGTGDPVLRHGTWNLVRIENTLAVPGLPVQAKDLPLDTRERNGIGWTLATHRVAADFVLKDVKETVTTRCHACGTDASLRVLVKAAVTGAGLISESPQNNFAAMKCTLDFTLPSGQTQKTTEDYSHHRLYQIYAGSFPARVPRDSFSKQGEFECGGAGIWLKEEEDFTLNFHLFMEEEGGGGFGGSVTFNFFYKWKGWDYVSPNTPTSPGGVDVGVLDREGQYRWAQKQEASALESRLISNAARLFSSPSVNSEKLSSAFADVSVIIADRAAKANFSADDKDAASTNWSTHKNWAAYQGPKAALDNLQQRLSAAFKYLSRSQKDLFFADVSVAMAKAEVATPGNQAAAAAADGPFVKPQKDVFAVGESIDVDYGNVKGSGWDWVVIAQPGNETHASGLYEGVTAKHTFRFDENDNSAKDRRGTRSFPALPEGTYEARYISWDGGNNLPVARVRFKVGNASPPPPGERNPTPPGNANPPPFKVKDLTGLWRNPGGNGIYRVRQIGSKLVWGLDAVAMGSFANMFQGQVNGDTIDGVWEDLPGSPTIGGGRMLLKIESECRFVRVSSVNRYGADIWVKQNSQCDAAAQAQRTSEVGAKPTTTKTSPATEAKAQPKVEEIPEKVTPPSKPQSGSRTTQTASNTTQNKTAKPRVEEIPENNSTKIAANKPPIKTPTKPPVVEEIPETASTNVASNRPRSNPPRVEEIPETNTRNPSSSTSNSGSNRSKSSGSSGNNQAKEPKKEKPKKEKKPKDPNEPDIWTRLGRAVRQGIEQQPTQQQPTNQQPAQQPAQQPNGQCHGGSYWLGTPTPNPWRLGAGGAGIHIPWSTPIGVTGTRFIVFFAGTNRMLIPDGSLPENANACGFSQPMYPSVAGTFDAYLFRGNTPVAGPVRFVVTQ